MLLLLSFLFFSSSSSSYYYYSGPSPRPSPQPGGGGQGQLAPTAEPRAWTTGPPTDSPVLCFFPRRRLGWTRAATMRLVTFVLVDSHLFRVLSSSVRPASPTDFRALTSMASYRFVVRISAPSRSNSSDQIALKHLQWGRSILASSNILRSAAENESGSALRLRPQRPPRVASPGWSMPPCRAPTPPRIYTYIYIYICIYIYIYIYIYTHAHTYYYIILYHIITYYVTLYYTMSYYSILYYTILYYTISYDII